MRLTAMVRLVIEEMTEDDTQRRGERLAPRVAVRQVAIEMRGFHAIDQFDEGRVLRRPLGPQRRQLLMQNLV
jgi:hypothetical protein